jgi:TetR/AcrR family transcriptional regulator, regulator of cefoperazone and chloramphenicol sensitivity
MPRADGRIDLLDAAERLFGEHGIPPVSDRKIAEAAGNSNHSAVKYYYGGRTGLLQALLDRHLTALEPGRKAMHDQSESLLGDIRALVIPVTMTFAELPPPSWRARFLRQAYNDPATVELLRTNADRAPAAGALLASIAGRLSHIDPRIVEARARLMTHIIVTACADIEENAEASADRPWAEAGDFLCDALAGLLQAPVTIPAPV